jgi:protein SCO1/2
MKKFVLVLLLMSGCAKKPELPTFGAIPDFSLSGIDSSAAQPVTLHTLEGKVWIADFIFTHCEGTCPDMTGMMRKLQTRLPAEARLVSFTVDPTRDTQEALKQYAKGIGADTNRWLFLTGSRDALYKLCREGFKLPVADTEGTEAEPIAHSTRFVLIDQKGQIRGYYSLEDETTPDAITAAVRRLL